MSVLQWWVAAATVAVGTFLAYIAVLAVLIVRERRRNRRRVHFDRLVSQACETIDPPRHRSAQPREHP